MRNITNRWTGATGSDFRIIVGPAQLLGNAVARSTQPFGVFPFLEVALKTKRFIYSSAPSNCHGYKALLVQSRDGGFISRDCLKCGRSDYVRPDQMPELNCEFCDAVLTVQKADGVNYHYVCGSCNRRWHLGSLLPAWNELFEYSGLAANGDGVLH